MDLDRATLAWFLADAKRQGLTLEQYERVNGVQLGPAFGAARRVAAHEITMADMKTAPTEAGAARRASGSRH